MTTIAVDTITLQFLNYWPLNLPNPPGLIHPNPYICIETSEDPLVLMAVKDSETGLITLQEDPARVESKTDAQWNSVRAQQSDLLYKSDWTCSVVDPPAPILAQRDQWVAYRQALRDVTKQSDPFSITWPSAPS
jgi:hypothetical protein